MLTDILTRLAIFVGVMLALSLVAFVGTERLKRTRTEWRQRVRSCVPALIVLGLVLILNRYVRWTEPESRFSFHASTWFRRQNWEREIILFFDGIEIWWVTDYFSWVYVYGYAFLLIFPGVAYFMLSDTRPFRRLVTAYALNYAIGVVFYILVIAYGPRNTMPEVITVLYDTSPQYESFMRDGSEYRYLTREVNRATNVFPSLHTSLAATVGIFAYRTRDTYRAWFPVAAILAASVAISTMYLALHWATDVVAGLTLAYISVRLSERLVGRWSVTELLTGVKNTSLEDVHAAVRERSPSDLLDRLRRNR